MIHYLNAGMYEEEWKRKDEAAFMAGFDDFAQRHGVALKAIAERTQLGYVCVDCAQTADGQLRPTLQGRRFLNELLQVFLRD